METQRAGKSIGKWMLISTWIIILVGLTALFGNWEEQQYNPNRSISSDNPAEITLQRNRYHHYVASGKINGKDVVFLLDTGATDVAVPASIAQTLGLKPGARAHARTANGIVEVRETVINELTLGSIHLQRVRASINPGMTGNEILLGMSALKDLEFTQRGSTLTLRKIH